MGLSRRAGRLRLAGLAVASAACLVGAAPGAALGAVNPWSSIHGCPVNGAAMLAVPAGTPSLCADLGAHVTHFNIGSKQAPGDYIDLGFGVVGPTDGTGTVVPGSFYDALGEFPAGAGVNLPSVDLCSLYPLFSWRWRQCEVGLDPISHLNDLEGVVDGVAYNLGQMSVRLELAGHPSALDLAGIEQPGQPALTLPVKFQVAALGAGKTCFVGTDSAPIVLHLVGTQAPAQTSTATDPNGYPVTFPTYTGSVIADTTFAEPKATGCGPKDLLDGLVDLQLGLPRAGGKNAFTMGYLITALATTTAGGAVLSQSYNAHLG